MVDTFPRQPRAGTVPNEARTVAHAGYVGVECITASGSTWFEVAQFAAGRRARAMRDALLELFAKPAADLEFIHMTRLPDRAYAVVWPNVKWVPNGSVTTSVSSCPAGTPYTTKERLYKASPLFTIAEVTSDDVRRYGRPAHEIAFLWTNNIRFAAHGWNATQDVMPTPVAGGTIPLLPTPKRWTFDPLTRSATRYGYGECQPNFQTANGEIFHTMDLVVAVPRAVMDQPRWARNQWVRIGYGARSCRARLVDCAAATTSTSRVAWRRRWGSPAPGR